MEFSKKEKDPYAPPIIVSYLGPPSSYTHQAALKCINTDCFNFQSATTIRDVFQAVELENATLGVIPIENSTNGHVILSFEILADRTNQYPNVNICQETYLNVSHFLLGRCMSRHTNDSPISSGTCISTISTDLESSSSPLCDLKYIKRLYSHPQAWGQCEIFLGAYLKNIDRIDVSSTSRAAEIVAEDVTCTSAAIASKLASDIHGLDILAEKIEDKEDNMTRFLILRKGDNIKTGLSDRTKTMISFRINHESPGALASVLQCFVTFSLNLTSINSRPTMEIPFQYIFFLEFQGSLYNDPGDRVKNTLNALQKYVQNWRYLGSWDDKLEEQKFPNLIPI